MIVVLATYLATASGGVFPPSPGLRRLYPLGVFFLPSFDFTGEGVGIVDRSPLIFSSDSDPSQWLRLYPKHFPGAQPDLQGRFNLIFEGS